jgi:DNA-binding NarL/FixJ family response regulator
MTDPIRIMLVDDHSQIHHALIALNDLFDDLQIVAHASNGQEAIQLCTQQDIDVIIMDVVMPTMGGVETTKIIHENHPEIRIFALSSFHDNQDVRDMLKAGAIGYILKNTSIHDLAHTIRAAHTGTSVFSPEVTEILVHLPKSLPTESFGLSGRELEVLALMVKGLNNKEIAHKLTISIATVKFHVGSIFAKLNVSGRVEAVTLALEKQLLP